jgi:error-prone DNA polymerase
VLEEKLVKGMMARSIPVATCDVIRKLIRGFASYGFPESHAASFALIAYASTYFKAHHPAAFYAALLNAWPMGFYHPATLVKDAQRHGIDVRPIDVLTSGWNCRWETPQAFSLGLRFVKGLTPSTGQAIEATQAKPYSDAEDLRRRSGASGSELEQLGYAGAFGSLGLTRRGALWQVAQAGRPLGELFEGRALDADSPLPEMSEREENEADYRSAGLTAGPHLMSFLREDLRRQGVLSKAELEAQPNGACVRTAGAVIVRQRPGSAKGFVFVTLEDETGLLQAIVRPDLFQAQRATVLDAKVLWVEGILQKEKENLSVRAQRLKIIDASACVQSHDFH